MPGQVAAVVALVALAAAMVESGQRGFTSALVSGGFVIAAVAGVAFTLVEARRRKPMLPLGLFRSRTFSAATAIGLVVNIAFYGLIFVFSLYFQTTRHYSALVTGLAFVPSTAAVLAGNLIAGRVVAAIGTRRVLAGASLLMAIALAGLLIVGSDTAYAAIVAQLTVVGFGLGLLVPTMTSALLSSVDASRSGVASGTLNTARQTGSVVGVALFGSLVGATAAHPNSALVSGLRDGIAISIVLAVIAFALALAITNEVSS